MEEELRLVLERSDVRRPARGLDDAAGDVEQERARDAAGGGGVHQRRSGQIVQ